ncbi:hypothetical protein ACIA8K_26085 [Catenuloplanes sp. NPDC051500]|uniref:hypothetical protein n=1 Tax=Catenuloplanes sp. NPDC051500 TaxID=3363959 RepID=UPI003798DE87
MRTSVLTGLREFPPALRALTAVAVTAAAAVIAVVLLANALSFWLDADRVLANLLLGAAIMLVAAAGTVWFRMVPAARWLGVPVALGLAVLFWDLLIAFLPA